MKLADCELIPAEVCDVNDPDKEGKIKCIIPGYIDKSFENKPWVRPFMTFGNQSFSQMVKGYKVWVLVNIKNLNEFWYLPFFQVSVTTAEALENNYENNPDVLMARTGGCNNDSILSFDDTNGYNMQSDTNSLKITPNGKLSLSSQNSQISISGEQVILGDKNEDTDQENAVLGNKLEYLLRRLLDNMNQLKIAASNGPCGTLKPGFEKTYEELDTDIQNILSDKVFLTK